MGRQARQAGHAAAQDVRAHSSSTHALLLARATQDGAAAAPPPAADLVQQVADAAASYGFFQLVNHGLDEQLLASHLAVTQR